MLLPTESKYYHQFIYIKAKNINNAYLHIENRFEGSWQLSSLFDNKETCINPSLDRDNLNRTFLMTLLQNARFVEGSLMWHDLIEPISPFNL